MKHILILLALVFSMASVQAQSNSLQQDYQSEKRYDSLDLYTLSFDELKKLAQKGHPDAQYNVGLMYYLGQDIAQNNAQALNWFEQAADQGQAKAQYYLGVIHEQGYGVEQNDELAAHWYEQSALQGISGAQFNLGVMYYRGLDYAKAFELFEQAAKQHDRDAQHNLGLMYLLAQGVDRDYFLAYMWYNIAALNGHNTAQNKRGVAARRMSAEQIAEAKNKSVKCLQSNYKDCEQNK